MYARAGAVFSERSEHGEGPSELQRTRLRRADYDHPSRDQFHRTQHQPQLYGDVAAAPRRTASPPPDRDNYFFAGSRHHFRYGSKFGILLVRIIGFAWEIFDISSFRTTKIDSSI